MPIFLAVKNGPKEILNSRVMMPKAICTIGSSPAADISFPNTPGLAPLHVKINLDGRDMLVEALYLNPVTAGGVKDLKHRIKLNATFMLGDALKLRFEHTPSKKGGAPPPAAEPESEEMFTLLPGAFKSVSPQAKTGPAAAPATAPSPSSAIASTLQAPPKAPSAPAAPGTPKAPAAAAPASGVKKTEPAKVPPKPAAVRAIAEVELPYGDPVTAEELSGIALFKGMPSTAMSKLPGSVVKRTFEPGEIICTEGEYGFTAFYIIEGSCDVYLQAPMAHVQSIKRDEDVGGLFGVVRHFTHKLLGRKKALGPKASAGPARFIPVDGPEDLPLDNPIVTLKAGDIFGEMSCISYYPRAATIRASEKCVMLEMLNNVLMAVKDNPACKAKFEKDYRARALDQHLRSVSIFSGLDDSFLEQLRNRVDLVNFKKGDVIVKEGDPSDAFFLIRFGNVKVSKKYPGGDVVLNYLGRSEFFGEMGLLKGGPRTATCSALDRVECVRIRKPDFDFMLSWYDDVRETLEKIAAKREQADREYAVRATAGGGLGGAQRGDFLGQGLMQAQSLLLLDLTKCTRCDECVRACADSHDGITRLVREGLRFDNNLVATSCRSCLDPVCMPGCPVGSIHRRESMEIMIEDWCIGCGLCAKNCPYGNINMHVFPGDAAVEEAPEAPAGEAKGEVKKAAPKEKENKKAVTCDLCHELSEPSCVYACPHDAAHRVDARKFFTSGGDIKASKV